jgi:imidazolonepropionase-like amidohydrolase
MLEAAKDRVFVAPTFGLAYASLHEAEAFGISRAAAIDIGLERELEIGIENMKALHRRGVRVLPGGDYGFAWNPIGRNARDLEHFVKLLGFTAMEAIVAATRHGGAIMGMGDELGQVREGCLADLLLVAGNPLADVAILQDRAKLIAIMKDGVFHKEPIRTAAARAAAE